MKAIITGGGTGGHIYPAIAVALELKKRGWDILYIGAKNGLEKDIAQEWNIKFKGVNVAPLPRKLNLNLFKSVFINLKGLYQSRKIIKNHQVDIVFGTGGFVAGSVVLAGYLAGKATFIHEQNAYPGITNKVLSRFSNKIAINFNEAKNHFSDKIKDKIIHTGNPVREIILKTDKKEGIDYFDFSPFAKTILIFGGSQGAESINKSLSGIYKYIKKNDNLQLIHLTGKKNYKEILSYLEKNNINVQDCPRIKTISYLEHMEYAYSVSDLVISRAGATALSEITAKGIAAILIPYPHATDNHQKYNAKYLTKNNAAVMIEENNLNEKKLLEVLKSIINDEKLLKEMSENSYKLGKRDSATLIANKIEEIVI